MRRGISSRAAERRHFYQQLKGLALKVKEAATELIGTNLSLKDNKESAMVNVVMKQETLVVRLARPKQRDCLKLPYRRLMVSITSVLLPCDHILAMAHRMNFWGLELYQLSLKHVETLIQD